MLQQIKTCPKIDKLLILLQEQTPMQGDAKKGICI